MNGNMILNMLEASIQNGQRIARQEIAANTTKAPTKYCGTCKAWRTYLNDGDFDICNQCENPILSEDEIENLNQKEFDQKNEHLAF